MTDSVVKRIKRSFIRLYLLDAGGDADNLTPKDYERINQGLDWRLAVYGKLRTAVRRDLISPDDLLDALSVLAIRRQVEDEVDLYQEGITTLSETTGAAEEADEDEFVDRMVTLTLAILVLVLIIGSVPSESDLTTEQQILVGAARLILQSEAGDPTNQTTAQLEQYLAGKAILENQDLLNDGLTTDQQIALQEQMDIAESSAVGLFADIDDEKFVDEGGEESLIFRILLWVGTAIFMFSFAQTLRADNPNLMWVYNPIKDHCTDCVRLNGQVHTAVAWRASGWVPRGRMLECMGYRCGCGLFETEEEVQGSF